jgi:hypothetical protein
MHVGLYLLYLSVTKERFLIIGSRSNYQTDQKDEREGLEIEELEGVGSERERLETDDLEGLLVVLAFTKNHYNSQCCQQLN